MKKRDKYDKYTSSFSVSFFLSSLSLNRFNRDGKKEDVLRKKVHKRWILWMDIGILYQINSFEKVFFPMFKIDIKLNRLMCNINSNHNHKIISLVAYYIY